MSGVRYGRSLAAVAAVLFVVQLGAVSSVAPPGQPAASDTSVPGQQPVIPEPVTLAEREAQVAELTSDLESPTSRVEPAVGEGEVLHPIPDHPGAYVITSAPDGREAAAASSEGGVPDVGLATPPDPPHSLVWMNPGSLEPEAKYWGVFVYNTADIGSWHVTVHRAVDDSVLYESCYVHEETSSSLGWGLLDIVGIPGLVVGDHYYAKVAVSRTFGTSTTSSDWSCATDWSGEAVSPIYTAIGGGALFGPSEVLGCGYDTVTGRPCVQEFRGDPINTATGSLAEVVTDAAVPGPGVDFRLMRTYSSASTTMSGPLGPGWSLSYPPSLSVTEDEVALRAEDGSYAYYISDGDGQWASKSVGVQSVLTGASDNGFTLTTSDHETLVFTGDGRLTEWSDRSGVGLSFGYTGNQLTSITDGAGRVVSLTYDSSSDLLTQVTLADGRWVGYSYTGGRLTSVSDLRGGITEYAYDGSGRLSSIVDANGNVIMQTQYDAATGRVSSQTDAAGGTSHLDYINAGFLNVNFQDGNGGWWTDVYEGSVLVFKLDPYGNFTGYGYDYDARILKPFRVRAGGHNTTATYDDRGNMLTRTDRLGNVETWTYDAANNVASYTDARGEPTSYTYDSHNRMTSEIDPLGGVTSYTYTALGQVETVTTPAGRTTTYSYDAEANLTAVTTPSGASTTYTYDSAGNMLTRTDPRGNVAGADPADFTTSYTYDEAGNVTSVTDPLGSTTMYGYDAVGNRTSVVDANGESTTYMYDPAGNLVEAADPLGNTTTMTYDLVGNLVSVTDPAGGATTYTYDAANRLVATTTPRGNLAGADPADFTTAYAYDDMGNLVSVSDPTGAATLTEFDELNRPVEVTDPLGQITEYDYDAAGNLVSTTDPTGAEYGQTFDPNNRLESTIDPLGNTTGYGYDADGLQVSQVSPVGDETTWAYDPDGRVVAMTDPRGNVAGANPADFTTTIAYDVAGNRIGVTDPLARTAEFAYDEAGRMTAMIDPAGNAIDYRYDPMGNLTQVTNANGAVTGYGFNAAGQLATVTNPAGDSYTYTHDPAGRVATKTTPEGRTTSYTYTADGLPETVTLPVGSIGYTYDPLGRTTGVNHSDSSADLAYTYDLAGRLHTATNGSTTAEYTYDPAGRITGIARGTQVLGYDWDLAGRLIERSLPDGRVQSYTWGDDSRLASTTLTTPAGGAGTHSLAYAYDPAGNLVEVTDQGATFARSSYTYDAADQLTGLVHRSNPAGDVLVEQAIGWGSTGPPDQVATTRDGSTTTSNYTYDLAGQLTSVCLTTSAGAACGAGDTQIDYGYDSNGNRTSLSTADTGGTSTTTYAYDSDDRPVSQTVDGVVTNLIYDANGNLAQETSTAGTRTYDYGLDDNLYGVALETGESVAYAYDESANRISRTVDGTLDASWTWDTLGLPTRVDQTDTTGAVVHQWWPDLQSDLGTAMADTASGEFVWLLGDYQGTVTDLTGQTVAGSATMEPFGDLLATSGDYAGNPLRFHGQYLDEFTGLYDLRARDYDAASGRFTGPDPVPAPTDSPFTSTYHYGYNQPTLLTDPSGLCAILCTAIVGAVAGGVVGGVDCWLSGDDGQTCLSKIGTGVGVGALAGATMGAAGAAGLGGWGLAGTSAAVGGLEYAGYESGVAYATGQPYGWQDAGQDFATGAAGGLVGAGVGEVAARAGRLGLDCLTLPTQTGRGITEADHALETAIAAGRVNRSAPTNHLNGAMAEELGWRFALRNLGHVGIQPPGKVTATGPDYITFDPRQRLIYIWDAKYSQSGASHPAADTIPAGTLQGWRTFLQNALNAYQGPHAASAKAALDAGNVIGRYFKYP